MQMNLDSVIASAIQGIAFLESNIEKCRKALAQIPYFNTQTAFKILDYDNDSKIYYLDIQYFMQLFGISITEKEAQYMVTDYKRGILELNYTDFCNLVLPRDDEKLKQEALSRKPTAKKEHKDQIATDIMYFFCRELDYQRETDLLRANCLQDVPLWNLLTQIFPDVNVITYDMGLLFTEQEYNLFKRRVQRGNSTKDILLQDLYQYLTQRTFSQQTVNQQNQSVQPEYQQQPSIQPQTNLKQPPNLAFQPQYQEQYVNQPQNNQNQNLAYTNPNQNVKFNQENQQFYRQQIPVNSRVWQLPVLMNQSPSIQQQGQFPIYQNHQNIYDDENLFLPRVRRIRRLPPRKTIQSPYVNGMIDYFSGWNNTYFDQDYYNNLEEEFIPDQRLQGRSQVLQRPHQRYRYWD